MRQSRQDLSQIAAVNKALVGRLNPEATARVLKGRKCTAYPAVKLNVILLGVHWYKLTILRRGVYEKFSNMFCTQWMLEVYAEDTRKMESLMNVDKGNLEKLVCNVCKAKYGACVRCSNGTCKTSFHPMCAREARHRMEIWGKFGCDNLELRAFCLKHSKV
ncbi:Histone-lysine N-methyltransferase ATX1 [Vitis vinifera]|uniref:Histone-lysine N-methyltransferase ATX1 n=1 Tax=Vitis vinifera TaxID=29760 RepID=A0A438G2W0_VITVI|nr:Histone-lysine N-methyltransferase ATX1 [Vitis vinifera]